MKIIYSEYERKHFENLAGECNLSPEELKDRYECMLESNFAQDVYDLMEEAK